MSSAAVYDVAGIGNAIVAVVVTVKPGFLLEYGPPPGDMVLLHELCHLRHHNHSARFYKALDAHMPRWREIKLRLDAMAEQLLPGLPKAACA